MELAAQDQAKREVGFLAVDRYVRDDTCVGLGTGTTAYWAVQRVGQLMRDGARLRAVATSSATERQCRDLAIPLVALGDEPIDVAIDGADEAAPDRALLKGGGGALFREKAVALAARAFVAIVTDAKLVEHLGAFPLPVEVVPFSLRYVSDAIDALGGRPNLRRHDGVPFTTDNGNVILDCAFGTILDPGALDGALRTVHGVIATGLFVGLASRVLVANVDGTTDEF